MEWEPEDEQPIDPLKQFETVANDATMFPTRCNRFMFKNRHFRIDVRRHIHPDRFFVTVYDFEQQTMKAIRNAAPKMEVYPLALSLAGDGGDELYHDATETETDTLEAEPEEIAAVINPDYINIISVAQDKRIAPDCSTETVTFTLPVIGERKMIVATLQNLDTLHLKQPRF
tara:strand:- start:619 stop:1134 length:516 start_codon:yes stop_codon:yes gene_type:complete